MRDLVVLDLDGTLLDTRLRHHGVYSEIVRGMGAEPIQLASLWRARRQMVPWPALLARTFGRPPRPEETEGFLRRFQGRIEAAEHLALDRLQPGVLRALTELRGSALKPILVTARRDQTALRGQLESLGLADAFVDVFATGGAAKHEPVRGLSERLVYWIGDTEEDLASARALGVPACLVCNGIRTRSHLAKLRPDLLVSGFGAAVPAVLAQASRSEAQLAAGRLQ